MGSQKPRLKLFYASIHPTAVHYYVPPRSSAGDTAEAGLTWAFSLRNWNELRDGIAPRSCCLRQVSIG